MVVGDLIKGRFFGLLFWPLWGNRGDHGLSKHTRSERLELVKKAVGPIQGVGGQGRGLYFSISNGFRKGGGETYSISTHQFHGTKGLELGLSITKIIHFNVSEQVRFLTILARGGHSHGHPIIDIMLVYLILGSSWVIAPTKHRFY